MSWKFLTAPEADARLPLVRAVTADATALAARLAAAQVAYRAEKSRPLTSQIVLNDRKREIHAVRAALDACAAELAAADAEPRDAGRGVIDFPSAIDGARVFLCWRLGEDRVDHFHAEGESHEQRKPLPEPVHAG